jgi:ArsR family transcriptional regulator
MKSLPLLDQPCCAPGAPPLEAGAARELARRFRALADPTRIAVVNRLAGEGEVCVCELVADFGLSQPTVSHHLRILREAGLVESRRNGTWAYYRLVPEALEGLARTLAA